MKPQTDLPPLPAASSIPTETDRLTAFMSEPFPTFPTDRESILSEFAV